MLKSLCFDAIIIIVCSIGITTARLVLKACCDGDKNCKTFQRPEEMFGTSCCGERILNDFEEICCDNVIRYRKQGGGFVSRCCGNQTLSYDQTCCQGIVHDIPNGECCGAQAYTRNNYNVLCCNGTLNTKVEPGTTCCGNTPYDGGIRENCCGGRVYLKELFDGCCPVLNSKSKTPQYRQFNLKTHLCCDMPIEKDSNMKCCYLQNSDGTFTPKSYDYTRGCCTYPFKKITAKLGNTCIPDATSPPFLETTTREQTLTTDEEEEGPEDEFTTRGSVALTTEEPFSETTPRDDDDRDG